MICRASHARNVQILFRRSNVRLNNHRGFAAIASGSFSYESSDVVGVKVASRDLPGPTTHLAVVAKAGTRYQPLPGFSDGLEKFAFKVGNLRTNCHSCRWKSELLVFMITRLLTTNTEYPQAFFSSNHEGS